MRFLSVCSGIEAASEALTPLGYVAVGFAEIDKAASLVLVHRFGSNMPGEPLSTNGVPNHGDFTTIDPGAVGPVDLLIGGTPCQGFSIAGLRGSLSDARSNLALAFLVLAHGLAEKAGLRNALWENVPGVLNTPDNAFGCFLGGLVGASDALLPCAPPARGRSNVGWAWKPARRDPILDDDGEETGEFIDRPAEHVAKWPRAGMASGPRARLAWRVLDAQYFGLAQRRERVFVVADFGNGADPVKVLFERQGLHGNPAPSREPGQAVARPITPGSGSSSGYRNDADTADTADNLVYLGNAEGGAIDIPFLTSSNLGKTVNNQTPLLGVAPPLTGNPYGDHESREGLLVPLAFKPSHFTRGKDGAPSPLAPPLSADADKGDQDTLVCAPMAVAHVDIAPTVLSGAPRKGAGNRARSGDSKDGLIVPVAYRTSPNVGAWETGDRIDALTTSTDPTAHLIAFDTTQITSPVSRANPKSGDPCHTLSKGMHPPAIAFQERFRGDDGRGYDRPPAVSEDIAGALETVKPWSVAYGITPDAFDRSGEGAGGTAGERSGLGISEEQSPTLRAKRPAAVAYDLRGRDGGAEFEGPHDTANIRAASGGSSRSYVAQAWAVRRLLPVECERLQGFSDYWTAISGAADGPRYKQLGNSMAVPCIAWLGTRIKKFAPDA